MLALDYVFFKVASTLKAFSFILRSEHYARMARNNSTRILKYSLSFSKQMTSVQVAVASLSSLPFLRVWIRSLFLSSHSFFETCRWL